MWVTDAVYVDNLPAGVFSGDGRVCVGTSLPKATCVNNAPDSVSKENTSRISPAFRNVFVALVPEEE